MRPPEPAGVRPARPHESAVARALRTVRQMGRETLWVITGQMLAVLSVFVGIKLIAGRLGPSAYGELALAMTAVTLSQQLLVGPIAGGIMRMYGQSTEVGEARVLWRVSRRLIHVGAAAVGVLTVLCCIVLARTGQGPWIGVVIASSGYAILMAYSAAMNALQMAARRRATVALHQGGGEALRMAAAVVAMALAAPTALAALCGYVAASVVVLLSQWYWMVRSQVLERGAAATGGTDTGSAGAWRGRLLTYSWPFAIMGGFYWAQLASERWALQAFEGVEAVGRYALLYQIGFVPTTLASGVLIQLLTPIVFSRAGDGRNPVQLHEARQLVGRLVAVALACTAGGGLLAYALRDAVFAAFVPAEFRDTAILWPLLVVAGGLFAVGQVASLLPMARGTSRVLVLPGVLLSALAVALNAAGAAQYGLAGVVGANVCFGVAYALWNLFLANRATPRAEHPPAPAVAVPVDPGTPRSPSTRYLWWMPGSRAVHRPTATRGLGACALSNQSEV